MVIHTLGFSSTNLVLFWEKVFLLVVVRYLQRHHTPNNLIFVKKMRLIPLFLLFLVMSSCFSRKGLTTTPKTFLATEAQLILAGKRTQSMRVLQITNPKDSILLRSKSQSFTVSSEDTLLAYFSDRLYATVRDPAHSGVGIAAPQVGILKNIIWIQRFDKIAKPFEVYYNPRIDKYTELKQTVLEGCLSIPDIQDTLHMRAYAILLQYDNPKGEHICEMIEDFTAVIFQHEIDHLNGILFTDHLKKEQEGAIGHGLD